MTPGVLISQALSRCGVAHPLAPTYTGRPNPQKKSRASTPNVRQVGGRATVWG